MSILEICHSFIELSKLVAKTRTSKFDFAEAFDDIMCGTHHCKIDLFFRIIITKIRETSQYGVQRLVTIFPRDGALKPGPVASGIACETSFAIVVKFADSDLHLVSSYFFCLGILDGNIDTKV